VIGGFAAVLAIVITVWQVNASDDNGDDPRLTLERVGVNDGVRVQADTADASTPEVVSGSAETQTSEIDVRLKNTGGVSAFVSKANATILSAQPLEDCIEAGGEVRATGSYSITVPNRPISEPLQVSQEIDYQVEAGKVDRLTFSVGPDRESLSSVEVWVYVVDLELEFDGPSSPLRVGPVALISRSGGGAKQLDSAIAKGYFECAEGNLSIFKDAVGLANTNSAELEELIARSEAELESDGSPAAEQCLTDGSGGLRIAEICMRFSRREIVARITFAQEPPPSVTQVMLEVQATGSASRLRWVARLYDVGWRVGFIEEDDPATIRTAGHGCGPCQIFGGGREVELTSPPGDLRNTDEVSITAELQDVADPDIPRTVARMPGQLVLKQGS